MTDTTESRRILMLLTSHDDLGGKRKTGFFASEAAEAWLVFTQAGYEVDTVTVQPGRPPIDGLDEDDETQQRFFAAVDLDNLPSLADLDPAQLNGYDAVFLPGGHGTVWDFPSAEVGQVVSNVWQSGGAVGAVCHGPSGLVAAVDQDGTPIVSGRRVTGFSNAEEHAMELQDVVPYLLADKLESLGGQVSNGPDFTEYVVRDGRLVTGQNPQSTFATAHALVEALAARSGGLARSGSGLTPQQPHHPGPDVGP